MRCHGCRNYWLFLAGARNTRCWSFAEQVLHGIASSKTLELKAAHRGKPQLDHAWRERDYEAGVER